MRFPAEVMVGGYGALGVSAMYSVLVRGAAPRIGRVGEDCDTQRSAHAAAAAECSRGKCSCEFRQPRRSAIRRRAGARRALLRGQTPASRSEERV